MSFSCTFQYDNLGRLINVQWDNCAQIEYELDPLGNRTSVVQSAPCALKYNVFTKNSDFTASDEQALYVLTAGGNVNVTLPVSGDNGAFMKIKAMSGTGTINCSGSDQIFRADGTQTTSWVMSPSNGVAELVAGTAGWIVT